MDGFGYSPNTQGNAVLAAKTPYLDMLWSSYPHTLLKAAEEEVGLGFGQIGNSEVGHMAIGSGRVIPSPLSRINDALSNGTFYTNDAFLQAMYHAKTHSSHLHLLGMISSAGVHAELMHMVSLLTLAKQQGLTTVFLHLILDGRDTGPREALTYLDMLQNHMKTIGLGTIATIAGRSYAMDRNKNWERTKAAYLVLTGQAPTGKLQSARGAIEDAYAQGLDDETIPPTIIRADGTIKDGDSLIFTNFREDRARQITNALSQPLMDQFDRGTHPQIMVATMTEYEKNLPVQVAFPKPAVPNTLSDVLAAQGVPQLHIAETEKYAHMTYFINGGRETQTTREDFVNIPSDPPEQFLTNPAMQAEQIATYVVNDLSKNLHTFYMVNFANLDMIGHTGEFERAVEAAQAVDAAVGQITDYILGSGGFVFITADHGNAEQMTDVKTGQKSKDHTINPVPFILAANHLKQQPSNQRITQGADVTGILQDVAPTILTHLGMQVPQEMTGTNVFAVQLP